jgi:predicted lipoprotein with Yx(FWY)xxD motif
MRVSTLALCLLVISCSDTSTSSRGTPPTSGATTSGASTPSTSHDKTVDTHEKPTDEPRGTQIITADSDYGSMLFDASGQPIYLFDAEDGSRPQCYDDCAKAWPPVLTDGAPSARDDVRPGLLGTTRRADGADQVTYAGHPLYHYADEGKYEVLCHNVEEFGGTWLVVRPDGTAAPG